MTQLNSTFVDAASLDFALAHITQFYDTDFFPRTEEFLAIRFSWPEVRSHILNHDIDQIVQAPPILEPWPKVRGGYRIVHRLEPMDALLFTAMAKTICVKVESCRAPADVACSYRFSDEPKSFFGDGNGFETYQMRCEELAKKYPFVLCLDIADFYNKIYLHRLQNAIELATGEHTNISKRIEYLLTRLNTKASQGIPVGPAASIVMSEALLIDVDQLLIGKGFEHVRYVDDFRIFGSSEYALVELLQSLTLYLHDAHRLSLNGQKTNVMSTEAFLKEELHNHYAQEKLQILEQIESVNPYTMEVEEVEEVLVDNAAELLTEALHKLVQFETLDLSLARTIVRRAKAHKIPDIAQKLLENFTFFAPVVNDIVLYLESVTNSDFIDEHLTKFVALTHHEAMGIRVVRLWTEWYFSRHSKLLENITIRSFVSGSSRLQPQALAALATNNQGWVKEHKTKFHQFGGWDRRAILLSARLLAKDERSHWFAALLQGGGLQPMDRWMIKWVAAGSPSLTDMMPPPPAAPELLF